MNEGGACDLDSHAPLFVEDSLSRRRSGFKAASASKLSAARFRNRTSLRQSNEEFPPSSGLSPADSATTCRRQFPSIFRR
jgi:hypothetical protein